ncbi:hypothetical protein [Roseibium sp.]|uniref:hypothetical protein n=1 Tax=Roseibium sp. TaxID=1936156 RepID=UPI003B51FDD2
MSKTARHFGRIAATLLVAFALIAGARAPMQHQMAGASDPTTVQVSMTCENMVKHAAVEMPTGTHDHGSSGNDRCCGGMLCAGYTLGGVAGGLIPDLLALSFAQSPPDALQVAEITLPERPPRDL